MDCNGRKAYFFSVMAACLHSVLTDYLDPYMYSCHEKLLPSIFLLSIFSADLCICSQLMLNLLAFRAKMSFAVTLGDPVTEQLDHLVAVNLSRLRGGLANFKKYSVYLFINSHALHLFKTQAKKLHLYLNCSTVLPLSCANPFTQKWEASSLAITCLSSF